MRKAAQQSVLLFPIILIIVASLYLLSPQNVFAADGINKQINFQGKVVNSNGANVSDGSYDFVFKLYSVSSGGSPIWTETRTGGNQVAVKGGVFRVSLGSVQALPGSVNFNSDSIYLGIEFNSDGEMAPRVRFASVPYAFNAEKVNGLTVTNTSDAPFSSTTTFKIADGKTVVVNNGLTFSGTDSTTFTFPTSSGTVVTLDSTGILINKTIGSTGLVFSGATTDITTATDENLTLAANGTGDIVLTTDADTSFTLSGFITDANAVLYTTTGGVVTRVAETETGSLCLLSGAGASGVPTWGSCGGGSQTPWTSDIDADGFDLGDLSNLGFRETTGAPTGTDVGLFRDNSGDLNLNALTSKSINLQINGTDEYSFSSTAISLNSNNITGAGAVTAASIALGTNPAAAGTLMLPNNTFITARNAANGGDVNLIKINGSDLVEFGANTAAFTLGGAITGNSQNLTGLSNFSASGTVTFSNATFTTEDNAVLYAGTSGVLGAVTTTSSGLCLTSNGANSAPTWASCPGGGSGTNYWQINNGVLSPGNQTLDFVLGGTATGSAKFSFGNINNGATATATFSGNLIMDARPNSTLAQQQTFTKISGTAGTIGDNATTGIASVSASTIFNGSLYVGTATINNQAEVYRYDGPQLGTWTKVSQSTAGTIAASGTSGIASISAMTTFDGSIYVGTSKMNEAEIYKYNGGTSWTKVSQAAGTIRSGGTTAIDGVTALAVYRGRLYAGTKEGAKAELYRFDGGTTWTQINTTAGTFVATNTINVDAITTLVTNDMYMYIGTLKNGDADVLRYAGGAGATNAFFLSMNAAGATGSYNINNANVTAVSEITAMTTYNGALVIGFRRNAAPGADIIVITDGASTGTTSPNSFQRLAAAAGQIDTGGTSNIDSIGALTVYNGRLYASTWEPTGAQIYRYESPGDWTLVSQATAGQIAAGGTTGIYGTTVLQSNHNKMYAMTTKYSTGAEVYQYEAYLDQSYALTFRATPGLNGGVLNQQMQEGSIYFLASTSAVANNKSSSNGAFAFTHSIVTRNGAYDVAEDYPTRDNTLEPGDLVSIDTNERGFVVKSEKAEESTVVGVYSENPALRLSQEDYAIDGVRAIPVALAGRVPVKVSTENGKIKSGDFLTSSSVPGVAMKATKAGVVVGQAMAPYEDAGVGKITVYVSSNSYNGTTASFFEDISSDSNGVESQILARLEEGTHDGLVSDVNTDILVASKKIISPEIFANSLSTKNATISGVLTVDVIRANRIEGLEFIQSENIAENTNSFKEFTSLSDSVATISARLAKLEELPIVGLFDLQTGSENIVSIAQNLMVSGSTTLAEATILDRLAIGDSLYITGNSIDVLGKDLEIQSLKQGGIVLLGGLVSIDVEGNVRTKGVLSAKTVETENLSITQYEIKQISDTEIETSSSAGLATIKAGHASLKINNSQVDKASIIFLSPRRNAKSIYIDGQDKGWFTTRRDEEATNDAEFNFLIIN